VGASDHTKYAGGIAVSRLSFFRLLATGGLALAAVPLAISSSAAARPPDLRQLLESLWLKVFDLPVDENPFAGGDPCLVLVNRRTGEPVLAPFAPPTPTTTCTAPAGTELFVTGWSSECSTVEGPPFHGDRKSELKKCARDADAGLIKPTVTFDGQPVRLKEVKTGLIEALLPDDNIFGVDAGTLIESVAHGWVALLPLTPGQHTLVIHNSGIYVAPPGPIDQLTTTTINVTP
jgi:hypothetical protein